MQIILAVTWGEWLWNWFDKHILGILDVIQYCTRSIGETLFGGVISTVTAVIPAIDIETLNGWFSAINYFVPMSEALGLAAMLFAVWVTISFYRFIKSWIPTVSGG